MGQMKDAIEKANIQVPTEQQPTNVQPTVMKGKVKWFNILKGYGFIIDKDGKERFVHRHGISKGRSMVFLDKDDEVEFTLETDGDGKVCCANVNRIGRAIGDKKDSEVTE